MDFLKCFIADYLEKHIVIVCFDRGVWTMHFIICVRVWMRVCAVHRTFKFQIQINSTHDIAVRFVRHIHGKITAIGKHL